MAHFIKGLVGAPDLLVSFASEHRLRAPIPLDQGFVLLPLLDDDLDTMIPAPQTGHVDGFVHLSEQLAALLRRASAAGSLVYLETEYFGGVGTQAAVAYRHGDVLVAPRASDAIGPINDALRAIGARVTEPGSDEFWSVGLQHHRQFDREPRADPACEALITLLVAEVPGLKLRYDEHVASNDGLLPYVFLPDVARFVMELVSGDARQRSDAARVIDVLDESMASANEKVVNLVAVGFVESLLGEEALDRVRPALGPRLAAELLSQEQWRPQMDGE